MARKLERDDAPGDLEILHPERVVVIQGRPITVREYGFVEGLRLRARLAPLLAGLHHITAGGDDITLPAVLDLVSEHLDEVLALVATAADVDRHWLDTLSDDDGQLLLMAWWGANGPFLMRQLQQQLLTEAQARRHRATARAHSAGATSTPPSSTTATTPPGSATTPSGS